MNIKLFSTLAFFVFQLISFGSIEEFYRMTDSFFNVNVRNEKVNYQNIYTNPDNLNKIVTLIASGKCIPNSDTDKKAFYINAYNILVIKSIIDNYPINSTQEILGFFDSETHLINGEKLTLNQIENDKLRHIYNDPRLHFVLVCGAIGCPPITNSSYRPESLNQQLEAQTKKAINNGNFIKADSMTEKVEISEIFKWYNNDFGGNTESIINFINSYKIKPLKPNTKLTYYQYDWRLNTYTESTLNNTNNQLYNAGTLLKKGQVDITLFNSIYTESEKNWLGKNFIGYRTTFATTLIQFTTGVSENARINIGFDLSLKASSTRGNHEMSMALEPFKFKNDPSHRAGIASFGPRIRLSPFKKIKNLTIQSTYSISPAKSPEGDSNLYWIEWDRHIWWNQIFYTKLIANNKIQLFTELDFLFRIRKYDTQVSMMDLPINLFVSYFPNSKVTFYVMGQHVPRFVPKAGTKQDWPINSYYTQAGIGTKYQLSSKLNLELLYSNFFIGKNTGLGSTLNIGIKYIK